MDSEPVIGKKWHARAARRAACSALLAMTWLAHSAATSPPPAQRKVVLSNGVLEAQWLVENGTLLGGTLKDLRSGTEIPLPAEPFALTLKGGTVLKASGLKLVGEPRTEPLAVVPGASRAAERIAGKALVAHMEDGEGHLAVTWWALLREGGAYLRQEVTLEARGADVPVTSIRLIDTHLPNAAVVGAVKGSPVVSEPWFLAFEHPLSDSRASGGRVICRLTRALPLKAGQRVTYSSVIGAA